MQKSWEMLAIQRAGDPHYESINLAPPSNLREQITGRLHGTTIRVMGTTQHIAAGGTFMPASAVSLLSQKITGQRLVLLRLSLTHY
jgi:hypothetical protein